MIQTTTRHQHHHLALRAGLEAMGLSFVVKESDRLPQLNAVTLPEGVDDAEVRGKLLNDYNLEIGAGLGALTIPLVQAAASVYAVEKDQRLHGLLKAELLVKKVSNVALIPEDILQVDYRPFFEGCWRQLLVCGNLPYNISSQVIIQLIRSRNFVTRAILMFQKELAQRLTAQPGTKDYGRLAVMLRYCADVKTIATLNASVFFPAPKIASEVLEFSFKNTLEYPEHDDGNNHSSNNLQNPKASDNPSFCQR